MRAFLEGLWIDFERTVPEVLGYHGTTVEKSKVIMAEGFKMGTCDWDWLGTGVYFWQDAPFRAVDWAHRGGSTGKKPPEGTLAVLEAKIRLEDCMDMLDNDWNENLRKWATVFRKNIPDEFKSRLVNGKPPNCNRLDFAFFNYLADLMQEEEDRPVRTIRAAVAEGKVLYPKSPIRLDSHVQISVRDLTLITAHRVVYSEER